MADPKEFLPQFLPIQGGLMALILSKGVAPSDADDLLQEAAVFMLEHIAEFTSGSNFKAWAFAITRNKILSHFDQRRRQQRRSGDLLQLAGLAADELEELTLREIDSMQVGALRQCLERLTGTSRELLALHYDQGKTAQEIAALQQRPAMSIRTLLCRIRHRLKECVEYRLLAEARPA